MPYAAVAHKLDEPLKIEDVQYRDLRQGEVYIKVTACGVCHSDLSVLNGILPSPVPIILGHEAAGIVEEVGPGVNSVRKGDHVIGLWKPSCGTCRYCREEKAHICDLGVNPSLQAMDRVKAGGTAVTEFLGVGGFAEYTILTENGLVKIDPSMPLEKAALLGCAVLTGFGAAENAAKIQAGDEVGVFGCGGVGLNIIQGAAHGGAKTIVAVDLDEKKLEMAKAFGATHAFNAADENLTKSVKAITAEGKGLDTAFDAVGNIKVVTSAMDTLCRGGKMVLVGVPAMQDSFPVHPFGNIFTERTIIGSVAGSISGSIILPKLISLYQEKKLKLDELVTKTYSLNEVNDAMNDLREGRNARGVLVM
jgi:S-(hydroxymethyl)glutathione dehydrogenase/alcohol dehydrogenase